MPEAECATRFTYAFYDNNILTEEKNKINVKSILADSLFFDVFGIDVWGGNPKEILSRPGFAIISRSIAEKIGGDVIGKNINFEISPDKYYEIGAVFEDLPANSSYAYDILISIPSISNIMWDGSINVLGNDRYFGFVKLKNNTDENAFPDAIERMR